MPKAQSYYSHSGSPSHRPPASPTAPIFSRRGNEKNRQFPLSRRTSRSPQRRVGKNGPFHRDAATWRSRGAVLSHVDDGGAQHWTLECSAAALRRIAGRFTSALAGPCYWHGVGVWLIRHHQQYCILGSAHVSARPGALGTLHRAPVGQGPPGPGWLAISFGFWLQVLVWTGACYWHGVGGFMFNSSSSRPGALGAGRLALGLGRGALGVANPSPIEEHKTEQSQVAVFRVS